MITDVFRHSLRYGSFPPFDYEREHESAGYVSIDEFVVLYEDGRGARVTDIMHDLDNSRSIVLLSGVLYEFTHEMATQFDQDTQALLRSGWKRVNE